MIATLASAMGARDALDAVNGHRRQGSWPGASPQRGGCRGNRARSPAFPPRVPQSVRAASARLAAAGVAPDRGVDFGAVVVKPNMAVPGLAGRYTPELELDPDPA
jgi:hypothetical protein